LYVIEGVGTATLRAGVGTQATVKTINQAFSLNTISSMTIGSQEAPGGLVVNGTISYNGLPITSGLIVPNIVKYARTTQQTTDLTAGGVIVCNVVEQNTSASDISVNTTTGQVTLAGGKIYRLRGSVPGFTTNTGVANLSFCWYNETTSAYVGEQAAQYVPANSSTYGALGGAAEVVIKPIVTTLLSLRILAVNGVTGLGGNTDFPTTGSYPWIDVEEISSNFIIDNLTALTVGTPTEPGTLTVNGTVTYNGAGVSLGQINQYYSYVLLTTSQTLLYPGTPTNIAFQQYSGNIPYDAGTGVWTLTAGLTYQFTAALCMAQNNGFLYFNWVDDVTGIIIPGSSSAAAVATVAITTVPMQFMYSPTTNQRVVIRNSQGTYAIVQELYSWATILQINPSFAISLPIVYINYLVVGGGGSGGVGVGSGGGAGGVLGGMMTYYYPNAITITVGAGGAGGYAGGGFNGNNGSNSALVLSLGPSFTAVGGGGGTNNKSGNSGGSGAGGGSAASGVWYGGTGTLGQGYSGGNSFGGSPYACGGGGGAGGNGQNASSASVAGAGGPGASYTIANVTASYGGGGGGGVGSGPGAGVGGVGGGGAGANAATATSGTANTGGGGGGAGNPGTSGSGGSGVVILDYPSNTSLFTITGSGTYTLGNYVSGGVTRQYIKVTVGSIRAAY